jgi:hypothetical protein
MSNSANWRTPITGSMLALGLSLLLSQAAYAQLSSAGSRLFVRDTPDGFPFAVFGRIDPGVPGFAEAMAVGDFNCDGIEDLAIGAPDANANNVVHSGQVVIAYGSALGLRSTDGIGLSQSSSGVPGSSEASDQFGWALAAGELRSSLVNGGCDDLVVGTPGEDFERPPPQPALVDAGSVTYLQGRSTGLTGVGSFNLPFQEEFAFGQPDPPQAGARFGHALAIANVFSSASTFSELIIGVPDFDAIPPFFQDSGAIDIRAANASGPLRRRIGRLFNDSCCNQQNRAFDDYGRQLTVGDFDGDSFQDVAIGVPGQTINGNESAGSFTVLYGGGPPIGSGGSRNFNLATAGIPGSIAAFDLFGDDMAAGDFDGDGDSDLVLGISRKIASDKFGRLIILNGRSGGVNAFDNSQVFTGTDVGLPADQQNLFGYAFAVGDFNGDGFDDLAAGAPIVDTFGAQDSGAVAVMYGSAVGIALTGAQLWHKGRFGIPGSPGVGEEFGAGLAAGDFNDDGVDDLVVAIPQQLIGTSPRGGVLVIYGHRPTGPELIFANGFE